MTADADVAAVQTRSVRTLVGGQVVGGIGLGATVGVASLLAEEVAGSKAWAGFAATAMTLGAGVLAVPLARLANSHGRRVALSTGWFLGALGGALVIVAATAGQLALLLVGMLLVGSGNAANLQSRYAATDLAPPHRRGRALSIVVWATTIGAMLGPNLIDPGATIAGYLGLPRLSGPVIFSALAFGVGAVLTWVVMRPDPLLLAQRLASEHDSTTRPERGTLRSAFGVVFRSGHATLGFVAIALAHTAMIGVMTMTPIHMKDGGAHIAVVGLTISLHVAGMYAFSPIMGLLVDKLGRVPLIVAAQGVLIAAVVVAGTSDGSTVRVTVGLFLLGLGWSAAVVAGSTLLADTIPPAQRASAQGLSDLAMNVVGASGSALSGTLLAHHGFGGLNTMAGLLVVPVLALVAVAAVQRRPTS